MNRDDHPRYSITDEGVQLEPTPADKRRAAEAELVRAKAALINVFMAMTLVYALVALPLAVWAAVRLIAHI